ncbi:MAG TPA: hypothetical protein VL860_13690 [Planctomycetota bacterium]|nr:hypothetical protein [Planctomycetota bacterium]
MTAADAAGEPPPANFYVWNWGTADDVDPAKIPHIAPVDRIGDVGSDGEVKYRSVKGNIYQVMLVMPAFDFDRNVYGSINHPFYLTIKFKDTGKHATNVFAAKGGCGFYGAGPVGSFGGAGDGQWKEETVIIPRSSLRTADNKTFTFKFAETQDNVPVASLTLYSGSTQMPGAAEKIAAAEKAVADKRAALRARLLPKFKDLGLPDPGPATEATAAEKARGFRVFFPPVSRQLFANSQPQAGELTDALTVYACPGETVSILAAVRGLEDLNAVIVTWHDPCLKIPVPPDDALKPNRFPPAAYRDVRWAVYTEQRIGSSWGTDYRICPEQLVLGRGHAVKPDRLEIAQVSCQPAVGTPPGEYKGELIFSAAPGRQLTVPITLVVYPFELQRPAHSTHGQFYYIEYGDSNPFELEDMAEHGMDMVVSGLGAPVAPGADGKRNTANTRNAFADLKRLGYRAPLVDGNGYLNGLLKDAKNHDTYVAIVKETMQLAKEAGFDEMGFFPVDEPHTVPLQELAKAACTWIKDAPGANTFITSNPTAVKVLDPVLNYVCYNLSYINDDLLKSLKPHQKLMFYCPSIDVNPEYNRYRPGYYMMKIGAYSSQYFAYMEFAADPFCDLDGENRDWNVVFPSMESPYPDPTLEWEAQRAGVYDYRYLYTLQKLVGEAKTKGKNAEADKAAKVLAEVLAAVDTDGNKAGGPAIGIEANVALKDKKLDPKEVAAAQTLLNSAWYDASRRKIALAIIDLQKVLK